MTAGTVVAFVSTGALLLAAVGLLAVRSAPGAARWLAFVVLVGFAVVANVADRTEVRELAPSLAAADLAEAGGDARTAMLRAAGRAGPRAVELRLDWSPAPRRDGADAPATSPIAERVPAAALGADARLPDAAPFAPEDVHVRAPARLEAGRPTLLELAVRGGDGDREAAVEPAGHAAELTVRDAAGVELLRERVELGQAPVQVPFVARAAGACSIELRIELDRDRRLIARGGFEVVEPRPVLVCEPSGVVAAALRAQGELVREVSGWPDDWREHGRIVLGRHLPVAHQRQLCRAVEDGLGLFVLSGAFGDAGEPLRDLLPVRPLPRTAEVAADGDGRGDDGERRPPDAPPDTKPPSEPPTEPPSEPPPEKPPETPPDDVGSTEGAGPISKDPVEVDKHEIAMVLVVDRSGSMGARLRGGETKMSFARTSALRTARALDRGDRVGIVTFGNEGAARTELPMTDAVDDDAVQAGVDRLGHSPEYTYLADGMRLAYELLAEEKAAVKHVVAISDGEFWDEAIMLGRLARQMRERRGITFSIVSFVDDSTDPRFKADARDIATMGGGTFVAASDPGFVPVIVSSEVTRALTRAGRDPQKRSDEPADEPEPNEQPDPDRPEPDRPEPPPEEPPDEPRPPSDREPEQPRLLPVHAISDSPLLAPDPGEWPSLGDATPCEALFDARVLLVVSDDGWPLLTFANRGLGRVAAFASDFGPESGGEFRSAPELPAWLAQWSAATSVAVPLAEPEELRQSGEVQPPAPVPHEVRWFDALSGAPNARADVAAEPDEPGPVQARTVVDQVVPAARVLLPLLLLLAVVERIASAIALRRGAH